MSYYITSKGKKVDIDSSKTELYLNRKDIVELNVSDCINLEKLDYSNNKLTKLDLSKCIKLTHLYCTNNQLTQLDTRKNIKLEYLDCDIKTNIVNINQYINNKKVEINQI